MVTKKHLPRRTILRSAGASLALPLLDAMVPAFTAIARTAAAPVPRLGIVYLPNGMEMTRWTPPKPGPALELSPILKPLEPFRDSMTLIGGLTSREAYGRGTDGVGDHSRASGVFLTGVHIKKTEGADFQAGISMDQIAARELGKQTQLASLEMTLEPIEIAGSCDPGYSCAYSATISWRGPTTPLPMEANPRVVFERMFGTVRSTDPAARRRSLDQDRSLLDSLREHVASLQARLGARDQAKLRDYLEAVRDIERRVQRTEEQLSRELPPIDQPEGIPPSFREHASLMFDLFAIAYQADLTRMVTLMIGRELSVRTYPETGVAEAHHPVSHHQNQADKLGKLARINTYHMQVVSELFAKLRSIQDGDGSLLDHSMILCGGGISDSDLHLHDNLPIFIAGGRSWGIPGGRFVQPGADTPLSNLQMTLLSKAGIRVERIGDSTGPVNLS